VPSQIPAIIAVSERGTLGEFNIGQVTVDERNIVQDERENEVPETPPLLPFGRGARLPNDTAICRSISSNPSRQEN
jgi:hypothetical protein